MNEHPGENGISIKWIKMKLIPVQMRKVFGLTIQIGLCVAKPKSAALIFVLFVAKVIIQSQGHHYLLIWQKINKQRKRMQWTSWALNLENNSICIIFQMTLEAMETRVAYYYLESLNINSSYTMKIFIV